MSLESLRAKLDVVDAELIEVLARRAGVVAEIWEWKRAHGVPRIDPAREREVRERLLTQAVGLGLSRDAVAAVLDQLIGRPLR